VRYRSHDVVRIRGGACACGTPGLRFVPLGRSDDMFIVRGVNVFPLGVQDVLGGFAGEITGEFRIVLHGAPPIDYDPLVEVEAPGAPDGLGERLRDSLRERLGFTARIELVDALPRTELKARRLFRAYAGDEPPAV
jgi:phenylacetate-CoA ligase